MTSTGPAPSALPRWARRRAHVHRGGTTDPRRWRFERATARIEPAVAPILAAHATDYWMRPLRRREVAPDLGHEAGRVVWTIDRVPVLDLRLAPRGPAWLVVHDFGLMEPLRKAVRSRHVRIRFATARDVVPRDQA